MELSWSFSMHNASYNGLAIGDFAFILAMQSNRAYIR